MSKNQAFYKQIRKDAQRALRGHWSRPIFSCFLLIAAVFSTMLFAIAGGELFRTFGIPFIPWGSLAAAVILTLFVFFPCITYSCKEEVYYDALATGRPFEDVISKNKGIVWESRQMRIGNLTVNVLGYGLFLMFFFCFVGVLKTLLPDAVFLQSVLFILLGVPGLLLTLYLVESISCLRWLAPVLLLEGYVSNKKQALAFSKGILRPNRQLLLNYFFASLPRLLLCFLVFPMFVILPEYRAGRAILCRYCLIKEQRKRLQNPEA